ncbi:hypothetical protein GBA52_019933 [Prunus armeniaca]|nr:hypothetical protein GBA52_019933 [Prunus armeniaca]
MARRRIESDRGSINPGCGAIQLERAPLAAVNIIQTGGAGAQIAIGKALEATAMAAGQKLLEWSDVVAIQAAEVKALWLT